MWSTPSPWVWMPIGDLELGDVGLPLAAHVHAEGLVDVVVELGHAARGRPEAVVAGVDDEGHAEHDDQREDAREQEAAGLSGRHPAAGAGRPLHLLGGAGLTHRVAHPTRGVARRPIRAGGASGRPADRLSVAARAKAARVGLRGVTRAARGRPAAARRTRSSRVGQEVADRLGPGARRPRPGRGSPASPTTSGSDVASAATTAAPAAIASRAGQAEALVAGRHRHDVGQLEQARDVGVRDAPEPSHLLAAAAGSRRSASATAALARPRSAGEHEHGVGVVARSTALEGREQRGVVLVGVGDGGVQHHRPREPVALDEDVGGGGRRSDGHGVRDHHHVVAAAAPKRSSTVRRTNSLGTATRRAGAHAPAARPVPR